jgi:hypothetical protein
MAFELYTTPNNPDVFLHWRTDVVSLVFDDAAPGELVTQVAADICEESFNEWSNLVCGETPTPFTFNFDGTVSGKLVGYDEEPGASNENMIIWIKSSVSWRHGPGVLALTSLTYDTLNGQIVDGDIELNDADFAFSMSPGSSEVDLKNTVVHEAGHFLGLDHSTVPAASMFAKAPLAETLKRDLDSDDVNGFCAIYGPDGFSPSAQWKHKDNSGCALGRGRPYNPWIFALWLILFSVWRARRPNRRKPIPAPTR